MRKITEGERVLRKSFVSEEVEKYLKSWQKRIDGSRVRDGQSKRM